MIRREATVLTAPETAHGSNGTHSTPDEAATVVSLLGDSARAFGDREFLRCPDRSLSFAAAAGEVTAWSRDLLRRGIRPGDRVAIMLPNDSRWPLSWLATLQTGAIAVPVNRAYRSADLDYVLNDSGATLVITDEESGPVLAETSRVRFGAARVVLVDELSGAGGDAPDRPGPTVRRGDLANLQYTSGTSGFPKACMLTHDYWVRMGRLTAAYTGIHPGDVVLTAQPFSYLDPMWNTMLCLTAGFPLVVLPGFSASGFWADVRRHRATLFYVLGAMPVLLYKQPPGPEDKKSRVRLAMCSGIAPDLHAKLEERWGVPWRETYGLTETGVDLAVPVDADNLVGSGKVGYPMPGKSVRIVDEHDRPVPAGAPGEIVTCGAPMMLGYWNQPAKTAASLRDGCFHTGDLGVMDADGAVSVVGRLKDMVRRGGENVACVEVERLLDQHPAVVMSAVAGIPDEVLGEEVKAYIQLAEGYRPAAATAQEIIAFARDRLARFKVPRRVEFVDDFPLTPSARIAKPELISRPRDTSRSYAIDVDHGTARRDQGVQ